MTPSEKEEGTRPEEGILNAALRLLAARRRGVEELRGRLLRKGFGREEVAGCLSWLEKRDLLDDEAFSRALIRDRLNFSPRGPSILRQELTRKGIARETADQVVEAVFEEEEISESDLAAGEARRWVRKQARSVHEALLGDRFTPSREKAWRRLYAYLGRRGFRGQSAILAIEAGLEEARKSLKEKE